MSNMSYCRFHNTVKDMEDCIEALHNDGVENVIEDANENEKPYIEKFITLCVDVSSKYGYYLN